MVNAYWQLNKFDIETRIADEGRPDLRRMVNVHEFTRPGMVLQNADVKVTATRVRHPPITQAYAYRFDAADRSIVISGDTAYSPELIELASGADVLVHEVMDRAGIETILRSLTNATTLREHLMASHTLVEDVGKVAAAAGVKTVVLSHLVPADDKSITDDMWTAGVRKYFSGADHCRPRPDGNHHVKLAKESSVSRSCRNHTIRNPTPSWNRPVWISSISPSAWTRRVRLPIAMDSVPCRVPRNPDRDK